MLCLKRSCELIGKAPGSRQNPLSAVSLPSGRAKKPDWMKMRANPPSKKYLALRSLARELGLSTVCEEAACPNINECWGSGTATFMMMGDTCTRSCKFCNVNHGKPMPLDPNEPRKLAEAIGKMGLKYAVITCVDRDDIIDGGAAHFAKCIGLLRKKFPELIIEVLVGDFLGRMNDVQKILDSDPHVFGHNIETVERLSPTVRDFRANYKQSLAVLAHAKKISPKIYTKSSIMVGLGETKPEVIQTMKDLRAVGVDALTIGQYLQPSAWNLQIKEYIPPKQFEWYRTKGMKMGFKYVEAGPFVRSSYKAGELYKNLCHYRPAKRKKTRGV